MLTSSSQPESTLLLFSLTLLPVRSMISFFPVLQLALYLTALCSLASSLHHSLLHVYKQITL